MNLHFSFTRFKYLAVIAACMLILSWRSEPNAASFKPGLDTLPTRLIRQSIIPFNGDFSVSGTHWADFNNDGKLDFYPHGSISVYINSDSLFTPNYSSGGSPYSAVADYDNDGDQDIFNGFAVANLFDTCLLRENNGNGTFSTRIPFPSDGFIKHALWTDYNLDGYLDLFLSYPPFGNYGKFYRNNGDGTFSYAFSLNYQNQSVSIIDFDGDGDEDLIATGSGFPTKVFEKIDTGFVTSTKSNLASFTEQTLGVSWGDYDNDGDPDLFVPDNTSSFSAMYINRGNGNFLDSPVFRIRLNGASWGDFNNDGFLDLYAACTGLAHVLYRNNTNNTFSQVSHFAFVGEIYGPQEFSFTGASWVDYDNDGFLDLQVGGWIPPPYSRLFKNETNSYNWFKVNLQGVYSNRNAIGAKLKIKANGVWQYRWLQSSSGSNSMNPLIQHFGLGTATSVDSLVVFWPLGNTQVLTNLQSNQMIQVSEILTQNIWTEAVDNSWHNPQNWSLGKIPDETSTAIIESGTCEINAPAVCSKVIVKTGATLNANQNLTIVKL